MSTKDLTKEEKTLIWSYINNSLMWVLGLTIVLLVGYIGGYYIAYNNIISNLGFLNKYSSYFTGTVLYWFELVGSLIGLLILDFSSRQLYPDLVRIKELKRRHGLSLKNFFKKSSLEDSIDENL